MAENPIFATPMLSDAATLAPNREDTGLEATYLQTMQPTEVWQADAATAPLQLDINLGAATTFNAVALLSTNAIATSSSKWFVSAADTQANLTTSPTILLGLTDMVAPGGVTGQRTHAFLWIPAGVTHTWVRLDIYHTASSKFTAGRLYVANAWQTAHPYAYDGTAPGYDDISRQTETDDGRLILRPIGPRKVLELDLPHLTPVEALSTLPQIVRTRAGRDILLVRDPSDATHLHEKMEYGVLGARIRTPHRFHLTYSAKLSVRGLT